MKILSLFDGISCARVALERAGIPISKYYASEVDKNAIVVAQKNYPDTIQLGDVTQIDGCHIGIISKGIDSLIGGSPCQDLSIAKKNRKGLDGERSGLFWHFVRIKNEVQPKYFILENVASMSKESKDIISKALGVEPIMIDAALVSAQRRKRLFWTNIPNVVLPEDRGILLKDILQLDHDFYGVYSDYNNKITENKAYTRGTGCGVSRSATFQQVITQPVRIAKIGKGGQGDRVYSIVGKSVSLSANGGGRGAKTGLYAVKDFVRKLTPIECERLQCLPDNWTEGISDTQRYRCLGNAFNVEVVAHILKGLANQ
jgi:DNA (cytosine-5)-methyltransferase 3A